MKVYEIVTNTILEELEQGNVPWRKPWKVNGDGIPKNYVSKRHYRGINALLLAVSGMAFTDSHWLTFNQVQQLGGKVNKGEKGHLVVFWKMLKKAEVTASEEETGMEVEDKQIPYLRYYLVWNIDQTTLTKPDQAVTHFDPMEECERIVSDMPNPPEIQHWGNRAVYKLRDDKIILPKPENFSNREEYYSTKFHEVVHSTGHPKRLNRSSILDYQPFGSPSYSEEELVAEIGCSFLCATTGISPVTLSNSVAYIKGWLSTFKNDKKMIIRAAAKAQKAVDYILSKES